MSEGSKNRGVQAPEGAREWLSQMQQLSEQIQKQQHNSQQMIQELMNTYLQLLSTPHSYLQEGMRLAQQDAPGTPQERSGGEDPKEDQYRESTKQSSE